MRKGIIKVPSNIPFLDDKGTPSLGEVFLLG